MNQSRYYSFNKYLQERFHEKCYKLALRGGETCPNRDGTCALGGCIFCGEGSGSFASDTIDEAIGKLSAKHIGNRYIAYFQSYTSTYRMKDSLIRRMEEAAADDRIAAISIATRPDCLGIDGKTTDIMSLLTELNRIKPVWIELGLQTVHEKTARSIRRGYELPVFEEAVRKLRTAGIEVIVHLILGLPGETEKDMLGSVHYLNDCDIQGVKFQLLHILHNTDLGRMFEAGDPALKRPADAMNYPFTLDEYADLICKCISNLRPDIVVHRITGDAPKKDLLAPLWSGDKKNVLNTISRHMEELDARQGAALD